VQEGPANRPKVRFENKIEPIRDQADTHKKTRRLQAIPIRAFKRKLGTFFLFCFLTFESNTQERTSQVIYNRRGGVLKKTITAWYVLLHLIKTGFMFSTALIPIKDEPNSWCQEIRKLLGPLRPGKKSGIHQEIPEIRLGNSLENGNSPGNNRNPPGKWLFSLPYVWAE
jgi:hypothetical protein